jgi:hypothetical protein
MMDADAAGFALACGILPPPPGGGRSANREAVSREVVNLLHPTPAARERSLPTLPLQGRVNACAASINIITKFPRAGGNP